MADGKAIISEEQYVRFTHGKESPSTRSKLSLSGATVVPLKPKFDDGAMELCKKKTRGKSEKFQQMLSQGKGVSVFEAVRQERLETGGAELPSAIEHLLNAKDNDGCTILHHAARCNHVDTVNVLVESDVDIDLVENNGYTALHVAVRHRNTEAVKVLLQRGADPSIPDNENATPLLFAARKGYSEIASLLLSDPRTDVNSANSDEITPFLAACSGGDRSLCEMLLARGAKLTSKSSNLTTALHFAALNGNVEICETLISTAKKQCTSLKDFLDDRDVEDTTALHMSCLKGYSRIAELLLRHGADYEAVKGVNLSTPLHLAAIHGHEKTTRLLISSGVAIESKDGHLQTPLHLAAIYNQTKVAEILLEKGADIEVKNMMDLTPFLIAVVNGAKETAAMLLEHGANLMAVDFANSSCLHLAVTYRQVEMVQLLLETGKEKLMELKRNDHKTAIHLAACYEESEILDILLKQSFSAEPRDINERIPLHHAAESGSLECIESLMECPMLLMTVDARDEHGMTPLHLAASNKHTATCVLLISKGADIAAQDNYRYTPLHLATKAGSLETVQYLLNPMLVNTLEIKDAEENTPLHLACAYNRLDVLKFLLDKGADVTVQNKNNKTGLDLAIEWDSVEVAKTLVKHKRWNEVVCSHTSKAPMEKLITKLPEVAEIVLDQCIGYSPHPTEHPDFTVTFNFTPLDSPSVFSNGYHYFFGPANMAKHQRESLLKHSVTQMLLRWKWLVLGKFINYFNFALFVVFVVLFSFFVVDQRKKVRLSFDSKVNTTSATTSEDSKAIPAVIVTFIIVKIMVELIQVGSLRLAYFKDYTNFLDLLLYSTSMIYILPYVTIDDLYGDARVHWTAGTFALLLCYVNLCLSLRRVSSVAIYVTMYVEVLVTFLKVITIFAIVLIGFALLFHVLLKEEDNFSSVWLSFVKVVVMMVGEMDYTDLLTTNVVGDVKVPGTNIPYVPLPALSYVMFLLFVLSVSIILMNLLVGLAVGDIDSIQKTATLRNLIDQALLVDSIQRRYPKWILRYAYKDFLEIKPNQNRFVQNLALSGLGLIDGDFLEAVRTRTSNLGDEDDEDLSNHDRQRLERQEERIKNLQASVDAQSELLRAIADKLHVQIET